MDAQNSELLALVEACLKSRSDRPWDTLVQKLHPIIVSAIRRVLSRYGTESAAGSDIDDLVQQTYLRLCNDNCQVLRNCQLMSGGAFVVYVRTIAANLAIDQLRKLRQTAPISELAATNNNGNETERRLLLAAVHKHLRQCSAAHYDRDRRVFLLYFREGLTAKAIAGIPVIGLTQKGVEALLARLVQCIRKILVESEGISRAPSSFIKGKAFGAS